MRLVVSQWEVVHMDKDKNELIEIINNIKNPKLISYLLNLIKGFLKLRS